MLHPDSAKPLSIGKLSKACGVKVETIRYYERIGLLPEPARSTNGYRQYQQVHVLELGFIRRARQMGFTLDQIRELMALNQGGAVCEEARRIAREHIAHLDAQIVDLNRLREALAKLEQHCQGGTATACPVMDTLRA